MLLNRGDNETIKEKNQCTMKAKHILHNIDTVIKAMYTYE